QPVPAHEAHHPAQHPCLPARPGAGGDGAGGRGHASAAGARTHAGGGAGRTRLNTGASPLVVVGGGIAGLCVALAAAPRPVWLVSRSHGAEGTASAMAQGGIAAAVGEGDDAAFHAVDTLVAGGCHNHVGAVLDLALAAPDAVHWLES